MNEQNSSSCCGTNNSATSSAAAGQRGRHAAAPQDMTAVQRGSGVHDSWQVRVGPKPFLMGDFTGAGNDADGEGPAHPVGLNAYSIDATTVTNAQFARFVAATSYVSTAEQRGTSSVFYLQVPPTATIHGTPDPQAWWWQTVEGAYWRAPFGAGSTIEDRPDHPVVHVSYLDAHAYCQWTGRALPTEAQWECASRGTILGETYPWGGQPPVEGERLKVNIFRGTFPDQPTAPVGTLPVMALPPNDIGMYQTVGNVWEWTTDAYVPDLYAERAAQTLTTGTAVDPHTPGDPARDEFILRGGSYLCHDSYCNRYRNSARIHGAPETTTSHTGFRTVRS
ncbi:formylglycine-generating enzyme family protein [Tsukamurella ocularis]|uniref:formylglycine-generating enzyme family protein n=1 Tax=Tsukamurella ocularis TaxID=1970234 RepID=UPI002169C13A|nr:formylglycine-generating enzyme family protein [Tsukamurella ocularis]MCS3782397.1 formylglycine-generating enzyme required for sulfatase activity [Tsukamurella ocularis]MCS3789802.1 formylglycine-generating enzyme required for sulfatase activity [Tsukamurella ocularis]MCS3853187.1 formylglycine-generating enzyme required for sulfatase activity [Tsukamurella ocularis]